jgi:decaprenylphospho-beta-D-ribofuranose 2-oxidase
MLEERERITRTIVDSDGRSGSGRYRLPEERLERVASWGGASSGMGYVYRPSTVDGIRDVYELARKSGHSVGLRGSGNSYGDATLNDENITLGLRRMNRILEWDPVRGLIRVEPGVTIMQLWQYVIEDGWWPPVVPGTSKPTVGGCAGMNVHGKNAWNSGTFGEHIQEFELMLPSGRIVTCSRAENSTLFHAAIGGFGMFGTFTSLTLNLRRIYSGMLDVRALARGNLADMISCFEELLPRSDYLVGWIDALAGGRSLGRGQIHQAQYLPPGVDTSSGQSLRLDRQQIPDTLFGIVPNSVMWRLMRPFMNDFGARLANIGKYWSSRLTNDSKYRQSHVAFHFLLDYIPGWKKSYGRDGLIQYQSFIPVDSALETYGSMLKLCQRHGLPSYLVVLKRHRPDDFLITHGVDGYSMAMDFRVTARRRRRLRELAARLDELVLAAGGKFYLAKDSTLRPEVARAYLGNEVVKTLKDLKEQYDPEYLLQSNLWRRLFDATN